MWPHTLERNPAARTMDQKSDANQTKIEYMSDLVRGIYRGEYAIAEIPEGVRGVPQFDDLVHPMRKIGYVRTGDVFIDDDGDTLTLDDMKRWWSWVKFSAIPFSEVPA